MLSLWHEVFVQRAHELKARILHPGIIVAHRDAIHLTEFEEQDLALEQDQEVLIYYEHRRVFKKQGARIHVLPEQEIEASSHVGFETTSEPASAESRQCYRVSTVIAELMAAVGPEPSCALLDVSATGYAVIAKGQYETGQSLPTTLRYNGKEFRGSACVQSVRELNSGRTRYGLLCDDPRKTGGDLARGLQHISMSVQREQLRRLAG